MDDFHIIEDTERSITLAFKSTDTTLINPIMDTLERDENVKITRYVNIHPELEEPQLIVEVKDDSTETAKEALINAAMTVSEYFSSINSSPISSKQPQVPSKQPQNTDKDKRPKMDKKDCAAADGEDDDAVSAGKRPKMDKKDCAAADGEEKKDSNATDDNNEN